MDLPSAFKVDVSFYRWIGIGVSAGKVFQYYVLFSFISILLENHILPEFGNRRLAEDPFPDEERGYGGTRNPLVFLVGHVGFEPTTS